MSDGGNIDADGAGSDGGGDGRPHHGAEHGGSRGGTSVFSSADEDGGGTEGGGVRDVGGGFQGDSRSGTRADEDGGGTEGGGAAPGGAGPQGGGLGGGAQTSGACGHVAGADRSGVVHPTGGTTAGRQNKDGPLKGKVYSRLQYKRTIIRSNMDAPPSGSSSNDDDDFMLAPFGPAATPRRQQPTSSTPSRPLTRGSSKCPEEIKKPTAAGKQAVTFKDAEPLNQSKRKLETAMQAQASKPASKARRTTAGAKSAGSAPRWNIRCAPDEVADMISKLNEEQKRVFIHGHHLSGLLDIKLKSSGPPSLLKWLYDHIDPENMTLEVGPEKKIKLTKEVVHHILGVPCKGQSLSDTASWSVRVSQAKSLRKELNLASAKDFSVEACIERIKKGGIDDLTKRCFFLVLFNRLFFSTASWQINNSEIGKTMDMSNFDDIDWCHLIYLDLCHAVRLWHKKLDEDQTAYTILGCSTVILIYYLDWLDHPDGPEDRFQTPRISKFTSNMVTNLSRADVVHEGQAIASYGKINFRPPSQTCYMVSPDLGSIYIPKLSKLVSGKLAGLSGSTRRRFEDMCIVYDKSVELQCMAIQAALNNIVEKQHDMAASLGDMIDEVLRAGVVDVQAEDNADDHPSGQTDHGHHGNQPELQLICSADDSKNDIKLAQGRSTAFPKPEIMDEDRTNEDQDNALPWPSTS